MKQKQLRTVVPRERMVEGVPYYRYRVEFRSIDGVIHFLSAAAGPLLVRLALRQAGRK